VTPTVTGYAIRVDNGPWMKVAASARRHTVGVPVGRHTITVRATYENAMTAGAAVRIRR